MGDDRGSSLGYPSGPRGGADHAQGTQRPIRGAEIRLSGTDIRTHTHSDGSSASWASRPATMSLRWRWATGGYLARSSSARVAGSSSTSSSRARLEREASGCPGARTSPRGSEQMRGVAGFGGLGLWAPRPARRPATSERPRPVRNRRLTGHARPCSAPRAGSGNAGGRRHAHAEANPRGA